MADYDKVIPPGQEGKVNIKIDGKKLFPGFFEKSFTVKTNDPDNPQFVLAVTGTVKKTFEFSREMRWSGFVDDKFSFEVDITNLLGTPVNITGARWADDVASKGLSEKIGLKLETIEKGKKYRLKLLKKKALTPESLQANVVLTTDFPKIKEKTIPMAFIVQKEVEIYPERLYYGEMIIPPGATKAFDRSLQYRRRPRGFSQDPQGGAEQGRHDGEDPGASARQIVPRNGVDQAVEQARAVRRFHQDLYEQSEVPGAHPRRRRQHPRRRGRRGSPSGQEIADRPNRARRCVPSRRCAFAYTGGQQ